MQVSILTCVSLYRSPRQLCVRLITCVISIASHVWIVSMPSRSHVRVSILITCVSYVYPSSHVWVTITSHVRIVSWVSGPALHLVIKIKNKKNEIWFLIDVARFPISIMDSGAVHWFSFEPSIFLIYIRCIMMPVESNFNRGSTHHMRHNTSQGISRWSMPISKVGGMERFHEIRMGKNQPSIEIQSNGH